METPAASTLMVVRECNAAGPLTDTLLGVIGINNIFCLTAFCLAGALLDLSAQMNGNASALHTLYVSIYPLVWQLAGSVALGFLVGLLLASWATRVTEHCESLILLIGCILLCVGVAMALELSTMIASLAVGATMVNLSADSRRLYQALSRTAPPFYAIFFVIAGADLNLGRLQTLGMLGLAYIVGRASGKFLGARLGARKAGLGVSVQRLLGFAILSQAGLAIGLTLNINRRYPEFAPAVATVVLAAVVVYEMIGPISARLAIVRSGEGQPRQADALSLLD